MPYSPPARARVRLPRIAAVIGVITLVAVTVWAAAGDRARPHSSGRSVGTLGSGFFDPAAPPPPEGTIRPKPGSWDAVHPPHGYRVVLLTAGDDRPTSAITAAVEEWARAEHVTLSTITVTEPDRLINGIVAAIDLTPNLVISAGPALVDALALVTASHLEQQFLLIGAQLPEPTVNVTAATWPGASSRGHEVPDTAHSFSPEAYKPESAAAAVRAGVASVLNDLTGIVIALE